MPRTKPKLIDRRTRNLRAVQLPFGHTKLESTVRDLGIEIDDALEIAEQSEDKLQVKWPVGSAGASKSRPAPLSPTTGRGIGLTIR